MTQGVAVLLVGLGKESTAVEVELKKSGHLLRIQEVSSPSEFEKCASDGKWDFVVAGGESPQIKLSDVITRFRAKLIETPVVLFGEVTSQEAGMAAVKLGVCDIVDPSSLWRLPVILEREASPGALRRQVVRLREAHAQADRFSTIGMYSSGIAHEINNALTNVAGSLELIGEHLNRLDGLNLPEKRDKIKAMLLKCKDSTERIKNLVRDMKVFARGEDQTKGPVDVRKVIDSTLNLLGAEIRHRAKVLKQYTDVPLVSINGTKLGLVLAKLFENAVQAIPDGFSDQHSISISVSIDEAKNLMIDVSDTGPGIPHANLGRVFDPFFSTKADDGRLGLGLPFCRRIMTQMGGSISVDSAPGSGTTFHLRIPTQATPARAEAPVPPNDGILLGQLDEAVPSARKGRVLVIDDEPDIADILSSTLDTDYEVVTTMSGKEGEKILLGPEAFDVVFCDMMMPDTTGMDVYEELKKKKPGEEKKFIFMTGGSYTQRAQDFLRYNSVKTIEKPFDLKSVRRLVETAVTKPKT